MNPSSQPAQPAPSPDGASAAPVTTLRRLTLAKEGHHFIFTYAPGLELQVLGHIVHMVQQPESGLDWYDAAVLSHQMGQQMTEELERMAAEVGQKDRPQP